jgi:hypothetical protein
VARSAVLTSLSSLAPSPTGHLHPPPEHDNERDPGDQQHGGERRRKPGLNDRERHDTCHGEVFPGAGGDVARGLR